MKDTTGRVEIDRLDLDNYHIWSIRMECMLTTMYAHHPAAANAEADVEAEGWVFAAGCYLDKDVRYASQIFNTEHLHRARQGQPDPEAEPEAAGCPTRGGVWAW